MTRGEQNNEHRKHMRVIHLSEVLQMEPGETVTATKGKLKSVFERNTGTNEHGDWSIQNVILADGELEIKVKVCDRETAIPSAWKGKLIYLTSVNGDKGITGLKVKEDTYKGKTSKILSATKTAEIGLQDGSEAPAPAPAPARQPDPEPEPRASTPAPAQPPARPAAPAPGSEAAIRAEILKTRAFLGQAINRFGFCVDAAFVILTKKNEQHGLSFDSDHIERVAVHLSIMCERANIGDGLPSGPLDKYLPPKPSPAPAPADQD
jgi:hypothetical protein